MFVQVQNEANELVHLTAITQIALSQSNADQGFHSTHFALVSKKECPLSLKIN